MSPENILADPDKKLAMLKLNKNEVKAIRKTVGILKNKYPVKQVVLFGSKARGDDVEGSDIDLLILTSRTLHWKEREAVINEIFDIEIEFDVVISILDTALSEWNHGMFSSFPIRESIFHEGVSAA